MDIVLVLAFAFVVSVAGGFGGAAIFELWMQRREKERM